MGRSSPSPAGQWLGVRPLCATPRNRPGGCSHALPVCRMLGELVPMNQPVKVWAKQRQSLSPQEPLHLPPGTSSRCPEPGLPPPVCLTWGLSWNSRGAGAPPWSGENGDHHRRQDCGKLRALPGWKASPGRGSREA